MTRWQKTRRTGMGAWSLSCLLALGGGVLSAADAPLEYEVKAAFLLNFTKFAEWPPAAFAESSAPIEICVLGKDPFGRTLNQVVQGEAVNGHQIVVRRIAEPPTPQTCQVLFVDPELKGLPKVLSSLPPAVLTVGEGERFISDGGMIAFVIDKRRVRFDISEAASQNAGLKLSSKLLSVARTVAR